MERDLDRSAIILAVEVVLAGCVAGPVDPVSEGGERRPSAEPVLADFAGCPDASYGNGSPVACNGTAVEGTWHATVPPGWVCTVGEGGFGIYRNVASAEEQYGVAYSVPAEAAPVGGVVDVRSGDRTYLYEWPLNGHVGTVGDYAEGFVALPPAPWGLVDVTFQALIFHSHVETDTPTLQGARLDQVWSLDGGEDDGNPDYHLVQRLTTQDRTYDFPVGTGGPLSGYSKAFSGTDFRVHFEVNPIVGFPPQSMSVAAGWPFCPVPT